MNIKWWKEDDMWSKDNSSPCHLPQHDIIKWLHPHEHSTTCTVVMPSTGNLLPSGFKVGAIYIVMPVWTQHMILWSGYACMNTAHDIINWLRLREHSTWYHKVVTPAWTQHMISWSGYTCMNTTLVLAGNLLPSGFKVGSIYIVILCDRVICVHVCYTKCIKLL